MAIIVRKARFPMNKQSSSLIDAETLAWIVAAQKGDESAFEALLSRYEPLIDSLVKGLLDETVSTVDECDDLRQEATIGFYRALMKFNHEQSDVSFGLYAKICIRNLLVSHLRKQRAKGQPILLEDDAAFTTCEDAADDLADQLAEEEAYTELYHRIRMVLSTYENQIWWLYHSGRTAKEIAHRLGKNEKSIQNAIYRIRRKLRTEIPNPSDMPK